jgi:hypothetical protein
MLSESSTLIPGRIPDTAARSDRGPTSPDLCSSVLPERTEHDTLVTVSRTAANPRPLSIDLSCRRLIDFLACA